MTMFYSTAKYVTPRGSRKTLMLDVEADSLQEAMTKAREDVGRRSKGRARKIDIVVVESRAVSDSIRA